jgi:hypothetical protein
MQHTAHARTPLSLCCSRLACASSCATGISVSRCASSWSMVRSSSSSVFKRASRSLTLICLPGRPTSGCLNLSFLRPSSFSCASSSCTSSCSCACSSSSTTAALAAAFRRLRGAMSRGGASNGPCSYFPCCICRFWEFSRFVGASSGPGLSRAMSRCCRAASRWRAWLRAFE